MVVKNEKYTEWTTAMVSVLRKQTYIFIQFKRVLITIVNKNTIQVLNGLIYQVSVFIIHLKMFKISK